jgi:D-arginine dehydrogenase
MDEESKMDRADFIVIGAGIAGVSAAAELAASHTVILLEAEDSPGFHATGRSAALFSEIYGNATIRSLSRASRARLAAPPSEFSNEPFLKSRGSLVIAADSQLDRLWSLASLSDVRRHAVAMSPAGACALCPLLRRDYVAGALYEPKASDIEVHGLLQAYLKQLRSRGGRMLTSAKVDGIDRGYGEWRVRFGHRQAAAPVLINAAGAWADELASLAQVPPIGLRPLRRTAMLVDFPQGVSMDRWPFVIDVDEQFYFKPDAGQLLLSPADETLAPPGDAYAEEWDIAVAIDRIGAAASIEVKRVKHSWAGLRSFAADRVPVVGYDNANPCFFWLAGQGGYGVQTAPAMAQIAAALAAHRQVPAKILDEGVDVMELSPTRHGLGSHAIAKN